MDFGIFGYDILNSNINILFEYIMKNPDLVNDNFKDIDDDSIEEMIRENGFDVVDIFINHDESRKFQNFLYEQVKDELYDTIDLSFYNELESQIIQSEYDNKLLIYRSVTLPDNIDDL